MQKTSKSRLAGLALLAPVLLLGAVAPMQMGIANPEAGANPTPAQTYASLMGNTQLGISDQMLHQTTMAKPGILTLRWGTDIPNAAAGKWCVTETPTGPVLASGIVNIPGPGQMGQFNIDLSTISKARTADKHYEQMNAYIHGRLVSRSRMSANEASASGALKTIAAKEEPDTPPTAPQPPATGPIKSFFIRVAPVSAQHTGLAMPSNVVHVTIP